MINVFVAGSTGMFGKQLVAELTLNLSKSNYKVYEISRRFVGDFSDMSSIEKLDLFLQLKIDRDDDNIFINCIAHTDVDKCSTLYDRYRFPNNSSINANTIIPWNFAVLCQKHSMRYFHISTDFIFDNEYNRINPKNAYGMQKYLAEVILNYVPVETTIFRTSTLYHESNYKCFPNMILTLLEKKIKGKNTEPLKIVNDIVSNPTYVRDAVIAMREFIQRGFRDQFINLVNDGSCSRFEFIDEILKHYAPKCRELIEPCTWSEFIVGKEDLYDYRPRNTTLESSKCLELRSWKDAVKDYCKTVII